MAQPGAGVHAAVGADEVEEVLERVQVAGVPVAAALEDGVVQAGEQLGGVQEDLGGGVHEVLGGGVAPVGATAGADAAVPEVGDGDGESSLEHQGVRQRPKRLQHPRRISGTTKT